MGYLTTLHDKLYYLSDSENIDHLIEAGGKKDKKVPSAVFFPFLTCYYETLIRIEDNVELSPELAPIFETRYGFKSFADYGGRKEFYTHQNDSVSFLLSSDKPGSLLALSMGLGKTAVTLETIKQKGYKKVLFVAPLILLTNWEIEAQKWIGVQLNRVYGRDLALDDLGGKESFVVTNYDTLVNHTKSFCQTGWDLVVFDESILVKNHTLKNSKEKERVKRGHACLTVRKRAIKCWLLSGSPISKFVDDLWAQFHLIDPTSFPSYWRFVNTYCRTREQVWGTQITGNKANIDFRHEFRDLMFVRNQKDELPDLPDYLTTEINVEMVPAQKQIYKDLMDDWLTELTNSGDQIRVTNRLTQDLRLQQVVSNTCNLGPTWPIHSGKLDALLNLFDTGEVQYPCVIWVNWVGSGQAILHALSDKLEKKFVHYIFGATSKPERDDILDRYKQNAIDVLVLSTQVGRFGLSLTNTKTVIYYDRSYDADAHLQSYYRVKRIGLKHIPQMFILRCPGTVEEFVEENLRDKTKSITRVSNGDLIGLLRSMGRNK